MDSLLPFWMVSAKSPRTVCVMLSRTFMAVHLLSEIPNSLGKNVLTLYQIRTDKHKHKCVSEDNVADRIIISFRMMKTNNAFLKSCTREAGVLASAKRSSDELQESDKTKEPSPRLVALASPDGIP